MLLYQVPLYPYMGMVWTNLEPQHGLLQLRHPTLGFGLLRFLPFAEASLSLPVLLLQQSRRQLGGASEVQTRLGLRSTCEQSRALQL